MPRVRAGEVSLGWREWGSGDVTVVFIHGNLASKDWIELAAPLFPGGLRVIGIDWRGCGESDRPRPTPIIPTTRCSSMRRTCWLRSMRSNIAFCHLATHSTGGIIAARMLLMQPRALRTGVRARSGDAARHVVQCRSDRPVSLDDGEPGGDARGDGDGGVLAVRRRRASRRTRCRGFARGSQKSRRCIERILEQTSVSPKASGSERRSTSTWSGRAAELDSRMPEIRHPHLVLWGERDGWIAPADLKTMAAAMPDCRLVVVPGIGHSMNSEMPALYAGYFGAWFGGLAR